MAKTRHIQQRMSQRGIKDEMLSLVGQFGSWNGDKCILNKKACILALSELEALKRKLTHMQKKGGVVLVHDGGYDITTYRLNSYIK